MIVYDLIDKPKGHRGPRYGLDWLNAAKAVGGTEALEVAVLAGHVETRDV